MSHFLRIMDMENTSRSAGYIRNHDARIAQLQFPVGWQFFTKQNIDKLVSRLSPKVLGIDFAYLCPTMQWAYDTRGRVMEQECASTLQQCIDKLNELVYNRVLTTLTGDKYSQVQSINVFHGRDMRSYDNPFWEPSVRVNNRRSHTTQVGDPSADPSNMFGS